MKKIIGSFFFRDEGNGCITGKYFNNGMPKPLVESASIISPNTLNLKYCGTYSTVWLDNITTPNSSQLEIGLKTPDIYELIWKDLNNPSNIIFKGEGMIVGDLLVGYYRGI